MRIAFRLGVYVDEVSRKLESPQPDGSLQSWAYVISEMTQEHVQKEIDQYNTDAVCSGLFAPFPSLCPPPARSILAADEHLQSNPDLTKVFITSADKTSVSVSGAAHARQECLPALAGPALLQVASALPVYDGICHAAHLYSQDDIGLIINGSPSKISHSRRVVVPLLSSQTGQPFAATTAGPLFLEASTELLTGTIYLGNVTSGILTAVGALGAASCQVDSFRATLISRGIVDALEAGLPQVELRRQDLLDWVSQEFEPRIPRSYEHSKLAVVGMACRMPGGANDPELFWELLEQGRDAHTTVPPDRFDLSTHLRPYGQDRERHVDALRELHGPPGVLDAGSSICPQRRCVNSGTMRYI